MIDYVTTLAVLSILIWPLAFVVALIYKLTQVKKIAYEQYPELYDRVTESDPAMDDKIGGCEMQDDVEYNDYDELPFCQLFNLGAEMCLLIDHIEMCPDETAFIRVVDDEGYTPLYKRKVKRDKAGNRFIIFNSINHYLDDRKTQPIVIKQ